MKAILIKIDDYFNKTNFKLIDFSKTGKQKINIQLAFDSLKFDASETNIEDKDYEWSEDDFDISENKKDKISAFMNL